MEELKNALKRDFNLGADEIEDIINAFALFIHIVEPNETILEIKDDPEDNKILECAIAANANYIISGDKHLLNLK
jgi:uncharacterized protein